MVALLLTGNTPRGCLALAKIIYGDSVPKFSAQSTVFSWRQSWCLEATCKHRRHVRDDLTSSTCWFLWRSNLYYHRATFLQLNTITFLLPFPNPFIPSEPSGSRRNDSNSQSAFLFEDILPIIRCNSLQKVLDWPFCNLWQRAEPPNSKSDDAIPKRRRIVWRVRVKPKQDSFWVFMERRLKILVAATSFAPPSSKIIKLPQICSDLSWDPHIAYWSLSKVVWI